MTHLTHAAQFKLLKNLAVGCIHVRLFNLTLTTTDPIQPQVVNIACFLHLFKENVGSPCLVRLLRPISSQTLTI